MVRVVSPSKRATPPLEWSHKSLILSTFPEEGEIQVETFLYWKACIGTKTGGKKIKLLVPPIKSQHWSFYYIWFSPSDCGTMVGIETTLPPFVLLLSNLIWRIRLCMFSCSLMVLWSRTRSQATLKGSTRIMCLDFASALLHYSLLDISPLHPFCNSRISGVG